ncbi:uncharacterized protein LOC135215397 [Macrobrachium nipponense]|uniref:uncharacterized protein LOC135215397 n=1 Tax=Macrobrachium nipponense TaxID=159736 RepID=UPI0030C820E3
MRFSFVFLVASLGHRLAVVVGTTVCLDYLACYNELFMNYSQFEIYFEDLAVRTANACGDFCQGRQPEAPLVMAKMIPMNERLVCGCGGEGALGNYSGVVEDDLFCKKCPDGSRQKCGGAETVSIYRRISDDEDCDKDTYGVPSLMVPTTTVKPTGSPTVVSMIHIGCYDESNINQSPVALYHMMWPQTSIDECSTICRSTAFHTSHLILKLLSESELLCGCGSHGSIGEPLAKADCSRGGPASQQCQFGCPAGTYSVYSLNGSESAKPVFLVILSFVIQYCCYWDIK